MNCFPSGHAAASISGNALHAVTAWWPEELMLLLCLSLLYLPCFFLQPLL
jgi:hypothetical protein